MTAKIIQFRDYQSAQAIERAHKALEEHLAHEANEIMNIALHGIPTTYDPGFYPDSNPREGA